MTEITRRVRITGRVQGVGYRAWTRQQALSLDLSGWVRNLPDGDVEALLHGSGTAIDTLLTRMAEGPTFARVTGITQRSGPDVRPVGFEIRR